MTELWIVTFILILIRVATFFVALPIFGRGTIPKTVIIGLSLGLSALWFSRLDTIPADLQGHPDGAVGWVGIWLLSMREVVVGLMLGLSFGLFIYPLQIAGSYLAQEMGLSIASISDPSTSNHSDVVSSLFQTLGLLLFFVTDLHHFVFATLASSFDRLPIGGGIRFSSAEVPVEALASVNQVGLSLIGPIGICLFLVLIILLVLSKAAPTMNLFSVGLSVRIFAGLFFVMLFAPNFLNAIHGSFESGQYWILSFMEQI